MTGNAIAVRLDGGRILAGSVVVGAVSACVYLAVSAIFAGGTHLFDAGRPDFFYLADALLHGRLWLEHARGPNDGVGDGARGYVPFAPFPALLLVPLVAAVGPSLAASWEPVVNAVLAGLGVGVCWILAAELGVTRTSHRLWIVVLFGFSTATWWVTTRGGVWHTGQLVASACTLLALVESFGRRRPFLIGLLAGAAFLTRAPLLFALPFYAWAVLPGPGHPDWEGGRHPSPLRPWTILALGFAPAFVASLAYNALRFGSPLESGYALATLPAFLELQRAKGLFSLAHLPMNVDYFLLRLPAFTSTFPFLHPDGYGMSVLLTSPGLLLAVRADWRRARPWALLATTGLVLVPSLLYYGGGWLQFGYRYFLDSVPFVIALCALAAARVGVGWAWRAAILFGVGVNLLGVYWVYHL